MSTFFQNCCTSASTSGAKAGSPARSPSPALAVAIALGLWRLSTMHDRQRAWSTSTPCRGCSCWLGLWASYRVVNLPAFADFLIAVEAEMNKVSWPTRPELFRASMVVLILIFALAFILFGVRLSFGTCCSGTYCTSSRNSGVTDDLNMIERAAGCGDRRRKRRRCEPLPAAEQPRRPVAGAGNRAGSRRRRRSREQRRPSRPAACRQLRGRRPPEPPCRGQPNGRRRGRRSRAEAERRKPRSRNRTRWIGTSSRCRATARSRSAKGCCGGWPSPAWDSTSAKSIVPTEKVTEFKGGKKRVIKRKLYPGYLVVHMEINDDTWFLVRETPGIGDFTGAAGHPSPMLPHEVARIVAKQEEKSEKAPKLKIAFREGERVKIKEGTFENFEGEVDSIDETNGRVTVMINIFGRSTPVELEYWQIEAL